MQQVVEGKDAQIADLHQQLDTAVSAEKARWASTFNALVASVKEPVQSLQQVQASKSLDSVVDCAYGATHSDPV